MAKDNIVLGVNLGRLEIESVKTNKNIKAEHPIPFASMQQLGITHRYSYKNRYSSQTVGERCKNCAVSRKKARKILEKPVLKLLQNHAQRRSVKEKKKENFHLFDECSSNVISDTLSLCILVDNCNQLKISSGCNDQHLTKVKKSNSNNWWKLNVSSDKQSPDSVTGKSQASSCSQQALNPPCDITIDELASYFETLVHIPKKMSLMAEMMYI